jgi:hypothetical protein
MSGEDEKALSQVVVDFFAAVRDQRITDMLALVDPEIICLPLVRPGRSVYEGYDGMIRFVSDMHSVFGRYQFEMDKITEQDGTTVTVQARLLPEPGRRPQAPLALIGVFTLHDGRITFVESEPATPTPLVAGAQIATQARRPQACRQAGPRRQRPAIHPGQPAPAGRVAAGGSTLRTVARAARCGENEGGVEPGACRLWCPEVRSVAGAELGPWMEAGMPHFDYVYHAGATANCLPLFGGMAAAGDPAPNLVGLAGTAGAALPALGGLPGAGFAGIAAVPGRVPYTWAALTAASLRIGLYPPGMHPLYEAAWRIANLRMASYTDVTGRLRRTPLLGNLETSERRYLSYFMGMNLSVYSATVSGFTFPMHFARFSTINGGAGVAYALNAAFAFNLPDIVFTDAVNATCQIWEAKGRVGAAAAGGFAAGGAPAVLNACMNQARTIASALVPGAGLTVPNARIGSVTRQDPTSYWCLDLDDPPDGSKRPREEHDVAATESFYREFYRPYVEMVADSQRTVTFAGRTYIVTDIPGSAARVGLDQRIYRLFTSNPAKRPATGSADLPAADIVSAIGDYLAAGYPQDPDDPNRFVSAEGIFTEATEHDITQPPG